LADIAVDLLSLVPETNMCCLVRFSPPVAGRCRVVPVTSTHPQLAVANLNVDRVHKSLEA